MDDFRKELSAMVTELKWLLIVKKNESAVVDTDVYRQGNILNREKDIINFEDATHRAVYDPSTVLNFRKDFERIQKEIGQI